MFWDFDTPTVGEIDNTRVRHFFIIIIFILVIYEAIHVEVVTLFLYVEYQ